MVNSATQHPAAQQGSLLQPTPQSHGNRSLRYITVFFVLVLAIWTGISFVPEPETILLPETKGYYDLSESDFADSVYRIEKFWESWPEALYTPQDLTTNTVPEPQFLPMSEYLTLQYATHRLRLALPPGKAYGISLNSSDFSMRIFIDNVEVDSVGVPGTSRETTVPRVLERTYYFTPSDEVTEIVVQAANFVYGRDGAYPPHLILGYSNNIEQRSKGNLAVSFMIVGCLLSAFLYHLGLFCLNRSRKTVLVFSLCCLLLATMNKKLILLLFPQYNWFVVIRIEYVVHFLTFAMLVLFLEMLHPRLLHRAVTRVYYALALGYILSTLMLDSTVFTGLLSYFEAASALMICYVVVRLAMALRRGKLQIWLSFAGVLVLGLLGMNDMLYFRGIMSIAPIAGQFFMTPIGMVFFVCCYSMVLSIEYAQIEREMLDAREKQQQLAAENTTLDRVNRMKTDLMTTISHEARTPLAVMASYSGLVSMELRAQGVDAQTAADLDQIVFEAKRVADLIDSMKRLVLRSEETSRRVPLNIAEIASQTARLYQPILERTGVELLVEIPETAPVVLGSPEELTQVFFNLLQNAKNHTPTGWVTVTLTSDGEAVTTSIANTGASIPAEIMPHLFEKGVRGDKGGDGLGLAICKEIVENHDGTITLVSEPGIGTTVTFILPAYHEGRTDGN